MKFVLTFMICILFVSPANACLITEWIPPSMSLQDLHDADDKEIDIKSKIDASIWGVFLETHKDRFDRKQPLAFSVGGTFKGNLQEEIYIISSQSDIIIGSHIYNLNLRQIDKNLWTDIQVPQRKLNWDKEACEVDPKSTRCSLYRLHQREIKYNCIAHIRHNSGCWFVREIPKVCQDYIKAAQVH